MTIEEGNKIIAVFDGGIAHDNKSWYKFDMGIAHDVVDLQYHSSWDWLMPVVEKIESLKYYPRIEMSDNNLHFCWIWDSKTPDDNPIVAEYSKSKIESVWLAVIQFIEWHNKQK